MSLPRQMIDAGFAIVHRDLRVFFSYRTRLMTQTVSIFFSIVFFYYMSKLVKVPQFESSDLYFAYAIVGLAILEVLTATLSQTPTAVRGELLAGTFERLVISPFGPAASIASMAIFPLVGALWIAVVTLVLAGVAFGLPLHWSTAALAIPSAILGAMAFLPFALIMSALVLLSKQAGRGLAFVVTALSITSGAFFPTSLLPGWLAWTADVQPMTPALSVLRWEIVGAPLPHPLGVEVAKLAGFTIVLLPIALFVLQKSVAICRRRGTLMEY